MADETRRIEVVANTQPEAQQLKRAFDWVQEQQKAQPGKPAPIEPAGKQPAGGGGASWFQSLRSSAVGMLKRAISEPLRALGAPGRVLTTAATTPPSEWPGRIRSFVTGMVWGIILDPFSELGAAGRIITAGLLTFGKPLITGALKLPFTLGKAGFGAFGAVGAAVGAGIGIAAAAAAITFVVVPLINLGLTYKILKASFRWAEDVTDQQMRVYGRTRRTFPGVIGQAFDAAQQTTWAKLNVVSGLFGESADAMWYGFTRRMQMAQRGGAAGGAKDMFADLGITPQAVRQYEEMRGGERLGLNDMLFLFIRRREVLDAQIMAAGEGTPQRAILMERKAKLLDSATRLFGINFADIIGAFNRHDLRQLNYAFEQAAPLGKPTDAENAQQNMNNFKIASESVKYTFGQIKEGIVASVQPIFTEIMEGIRSWLLSTSADGETMGMKLRNLASSLAIHAWKAVQILIDQINIEDFRGLMNLFTDWNPKKDLDHLLKLGHLLKLLFTPLAWLFKWSLWIFEKAEKLNKLLGSPISRGAEIVGEVAKGVWGAGTAAGVWYKAYRAAGGGAMGRAAARRAVGMYQAGIGPGSAYAREAMRTGQAPAYAAGGTAVPGDVVATARKVALESGPGGVDAFMRSQGYPRSGAWCGQFAASVIKSQGLKPPPNAQAAGSWRNWGQEVTGAPQPGDIVVVKGVSPRTGLEGRHVTIVESYDPKTGNITTIGGNQALSKYERDQGRTGRSVYNIANVYVRRGAEGAVPNAIQPGGETAQGPGAGSPGTQGNLYAKWAPSIIADLKAEFGFTHEQASGLVGNLGHESEGFKSLQEIGKGGAGQQKGGLGIGQWTAKRRTLFENYCSARSISPYSYEANVGYLKHELRTTHAYFVPMLKSARNLQEATAVTHRKFEIPQDVLDRTYVSYGKRLMYAQKAAGLPVTGAAAPAKVAAAAPPPPPPAPTKPTTVAMMTTAPPPTSLQRGEAAKQETAKREREKVASLTEAQAKKAAQENARKRLTEKPPSKDATDEAKKAAKVAADSFKKNIKDVSVPVKLPGEKDRETGEKMREAERQAA